MKYLLFLLLFPLGVSAQRIIDLSSMQRPGVPTLTITGAYSNFVTTAGSASASQSVVLNGSTLSSAVAVGPLTGYEFSTTNTTFSSSLSLPVSGGIITGQPINIYARLAAADAAGTYNGNINFVSGTASTTAAVTGTVNSSSGAHYRSVTIPSTLVANTDQTNFPIPFQCTSCTFLATTTNGGSVQSANGYDIEFSTDAAGSSLLNWEIESWDPVTGNITAWIKIPTLSHSANTIIYLRYGASGVSSFQGGTQGVVWDANFKQRYGMATTLTASGQTVPDATTNAINLTSNGTWGSGQRVAGKIGYATNILHANNDWLSFSAAQTYTTTYTIEGWYYVPVAPDNLTFAWTHSSGNAESFDFRLGYAELYNNGQVISDPSQATAATWYYFAMTINGTAGIFYRNGVSVNTSTTGAGVILDGIGNIFGTFTKDIIVDELRISSSVRSADWITTCYNLQNNATGYYTLGPQN